MSQLITGRHFGKHHFYLSLDDSQQIIEVVGNASRQLPDRLHFLRLAQLVLQLLPFRDVFCEDFEIRNLTCSVEHAPAAKTYQDGLSAKASPRALKSLTGTSTPELREKFIVVDRLVENLRSQTLKKQFSFGFVAEHFGHCAVDL